jgi:hypothetical protein
MSSLGFKVEGLRFNAFIVLDQIIYINLANTIPNELNPKP